MRLYQVKSIHFQLRHSIVKIYLFSNYHAVITQSHLRKQNSKMFRRELHLLGIPPPSNYTFPPTDVTTTTATTRRAMTGDRSSAASLTRDTRTGSTETRTGSTETRIGSTDSRTGSTRAMTVTTVSVPSNGNTQMHTTFLTTPPINSFVVRKSQKFVSLICNYILLCRVPIIYFYFFFGTL